MESTKYIGVGEFILNNGIENKYGDVIIEVEQDPVSGLGVTWDKSIQEFDKEMKRKIVEEVIGWIDGYAKSEIYLHVHVKKVGVRDEKEGENDFIRAIRNAFYDVLPKMGIEPPQIFSL